MNRLYLLGLLVKDWKNRDRALSFTNIIDFLKWIKDHSYKKQVVYDIYFYNATYDVTVFNYEFYLLMQDKSLGFKIKHKELINDKDLFISVKYSTKDWEIRIIDLWQWDKNQKIENYTRLLSPEHEQKGIIDYDKWDLELIKEGEETNWYFQYRNSNGELKTSSYQDELIYLSKDLLVMPKIKKHIEKTKAKSFVS
ncbi:hypothetical protein [Mycoplasmopsis columbinasalis]|uniref:hypothetical protein n=1 Tax=Mycoplasmopsis columbinasalis TaxID=114880 RepID=UPI00101D2BA5|nr:hypothetical protein [Mycoplasmopsis columbinasalis]